MHCTLHGPNPPLSCTWQTSPPEQFANTHCTELQPLGAEEENWNVLELEKAELTEREELFELEAKENVLDWEEFLELEVEDWSELLELAEE